MYTGFGHDRLDGESGDVVIKVTIIIFSIIIIIIIIAIIIAIS